VVVQGEPLDEGSSVTILVPDESEFTLPAEDEAALLQSISEADKGEVIDGDDVIQKIS